MRVWQQELAYMYRRFLKSPGLAFAIVVSIGLGIASNATIFSMVSRFILSPPPVGDPGRGDHQQGQRHGDDKAEQKSAHAYQIPKERDDTGRDR